MKIFYLFLSICFGHILVSCSSTKPSVTGGDKYFEAGEYELAIKEYAKSSTANTPKTIYSIAESYRLSNRPLKAQEYYEKAMNAWSKNAE